MMPDAPSPRHHDQTNDSSHKMNLTRLTRLETRENNLVLSLDMSGDWALNPTLGWGTHHSDVYRLGQLGIGRVQRQTYLSVVASTCTDVSGNYLQEIREPNKLEMVRVGHSGVHPSRDLWKRRA